MLGAVLGDIVGSLYEFDNIKTKDFPLFTDENFFTDDTVMTFAIFSALDKCDGNYENLEQQTVYEMRRFYELYPKKSYGYNFTSWLISSDPKPYNSFGNGSAMRVSAVPYFCKNIKDVINLSRKVTCPTHNHPEGLKGAEATAVCIWLALNKKDKNFIKTFVEETYYPLNYDYKNLVENYTFQASCQETVPQAIYCFLISNSFEDAVRTAVFVGGDCDTLTAITASIAGAYYGIDEELEYKTLSYLDPHLRTLYNRFKTIKNKNFKK
ncbi:MAG: ADP-ribosylglycohydrolase family protein [Clostridia bacterium]|nr:ADP-ribosylglycohydrolase family protein [Clostridia bacterium]